MDYYHHLRDSCYRGHIWLDASYYTKYHKFVFERNLNFVLDRSINK
nr:MAG TPA: hypothetical protein [Caudoviricetes sp.]